MQAKHNKLNLPNAFNSANTHRIVLYQPDVGGSDFERIEDILADGIGAVREALDLMRHLPADLVSPLNRAERVLRGAFDKRRLLSAECRDAIRRWLSEAVRCGEDYSQDNCLQAVRRRLVAALDASERVLDLLAAEREIGSHRGLGR